LSLLTIVLGVLCVTLVAGPPRIKAAKHEPPLLPRPELLTVLGNAQRQMIADYYWILTTEATGVAHTREEYRDVYDYALLISELDPKFQLVYSFAGAIIPVNLGRETWVNTDESTQILSKGFALFPNYLFLRIMYAYNLSVFHKRYQQAADILKETAKMPGAPKYLGVLATRLYGQAGAINAGLALATELSQSAADPATRQTFERRTKELILEGELQKIDQAIEEFKRTTGRMPATGLELVASGQLREIPEDPLGGTIVIGADGRSHSSAAEDERLEIYDPKKKLQD
ncbi:MAG TPA: hypothetical protein VN918_08565, partial [Myxococcaceae bacterium]|nr:hypothetical protein [Myxococcaceae bacterium]